MVGKTRCVLRELTCAVLLQSSGPLGSLPVEVDGATTTSGRRKRLYSLYSEFTIKVGLSHSLEEKQTGKRKS